MRLRLLTFVVLFATRGMYAFAQDEDDVISFKDGDTPPQSILAPHNDNVDKYAGPTPPGCYWDGTSPYCDGHCPPGYDGRGHDRCGDGFCCWSGFKVLCCKEKKEEWQYTSNDAASCSENQNVLEYLCCWKLHKNISVNRVVSGPAWLAGIGIGCSSIYRSEENGLVTREIAQGRYVAATLVWAPCWADRA